MWYCIKTKHSVVHAFVHTNQDGSLSTRAKWVKAREQEKMCAQ